MKSQNKISEYKQKIEALDSSKKQLLLKKYPQISGGQKGLWLKYREVKEDNSYNLGFLVKVTKILDASIIQKAALSTLNRHPALRAFFYECQNNIYMIQTPVEFSEVPIIDVGDIEAIKMQVRDDYARPFQLEENLPAKFKIFTSTDGIYISFLAHHIIVDGYSLGIIKNSLQSFLVGDKDSSVESTFFEVVRNSSVINNTISIEFWEKYYEGFENQTILWDSVEKNERGLALDLTFAIPSNVNKLLDKYISKQGCLPLCQDTCRLS